MLQRDAEFAQEDEIPLLFVLPLHAAFKPSKQIDSNGGMPEKYSTLLVEMSVHFGCGGKPFTESGRDPVRSLA